MSKTVKWIIIILLILTLVAVVFFIIREINKPTQQGPGTAPGGIASILGAYLPQLSNWVKGLFGGKGPDVVDCDPNRPGYEKDGTYNVNCGKNYTGCDPDKCDPLRSGWNQCGFPDNRCY